MTQSQDKAARLAAALRENLRKRKAQLRESDSVAVDRAATLPRDDDDQ